MNHSDQFIGPNEGLRSTPEYDYGFGYLPSDEEVERIMAYKATMLAMKQLDDGTAKAQVITHCLSMASPRESIERRMMQAKIALLESQIRRNEADMQTQQLLIDAMESLGRYRGEGLNEELY